MEQFTAPYGQDIELREIIHDSGVALLRVIVREGGRYQTIDLDPATAYRWGAAMRQWAEDRQRGIEPDA